MPDISGILSSTGVALEAQAFNVFGAAVANQSNGILGAIFGSTGTSINQNPNPIPSDRILHHGDWNPTPYSSAIASGLGGYDPKTKFLFKVHFDFDTDAAKEMASLGLDVGFSLNRDLTYSVKMIDLPKYEFDYEEVNMYNFRTKVLKRINHQPLNFVFYDDTANHAMKFMNLYLQLHMPLNRRNWDARANLENFGFAFSQALGGADSSMRQALHGMNTKQILRSLRIDQYYLNRSQPHLKGSQIRQAIYVNTFTFTNPRIMQFDLQDQDHAGTEPNTMSCQFDFDALFMKTGIVGDEMEKQTSGLLATYDILQGENRSGGQRLNGPSTPGGGGGNFLTPFINIIANQGGRLAQTSIAEKLYKTGIGNAAGGALGGVVSNVAGGLGTAAARTLKTIGSGVAAGITAPKAPPVTDNSVGGETTSQVGDTDG